MSFLMRLIMFLLTILACVVPTALYILLVWRLDRYEKEPIKLLAAAFVWGALPAIVISVVADSILQVPIVALSGGYSDVASSTLVAPVVEELAKGLALWGLFAWARNEFDDALDGIIYASLVGLGFAMTENLFYFVGALDEGGFSDWATVVLGRAFAFGFNHAMYTSFTGIGLGLARYTKNKGRRRLLMLGGLLLAMLAHLIHNGMLAATGGCMVSFVLDWIGVAIVLAVAISMSRRERQWITDALAVEVEAGVMNQRLASILANPRGRIERQIRALGADGLEQARAWRDLSDAATNLALKRHQLETMGEEKGNSDTIADLRGQIIAMRRALGDAQMARMRGCSSCGKPMGDDATLCPHCGTAQAPADSEA